MLKKVSVPLFAFLHKVLPMFVVGVCLIFASLASAENEMNPAEASLPTATSAAPKEVNKETAMSSLEAQEKLRIMYYKPMYFAYGSPLTKIQLSFRVPLLEEVPINLGYSQIIFWELGENSKPFLDATYNPEFFYRMNLDSSWLRFVDLGVWEHHSNGKGDDVSRSYDTSYIRTNIKYETKSWLAEFGVKFQYLYSIDDTNKDIVDYISPLEFQLKFLQRFDSLFDHLEVIFNFNPGGKYGTELNKGGYQLSFDFHLGGVKVVPAFYLQYYQGYAETLLNYNEKVSEFRAGFMF